MAERFEISYQLNEAIPEIGAVLHDVLAIYPVEREPVLLIREVDPQMLSVIAARSPSATLSTCHGCRPPISLSDLWSWYLEHAPGATPYLRLMR